MRATNRIRVILIITVMAIVAAAIVFDRPTSSHSWPNLLVDTPQFAFDAGAPEPFAGLGEYYSVRQDVRRCASPLCGGYFVKRVNHRWTRCANGRRMRECYVAEIDWNRQPEVEIGNALLRGDIIARRFAGFGNLGALRVTESWQSQSGRASADTFHRARDRGLRCITHPCLTHSLMKLNANLTRNVAGIDLAAAGASGEKISEAAAAMTHTDGVIVAGYLAPVSGPGGRAQTLKAMQFYLRAGSSIGGNPGGAKRCFRTGCSSQVCADHDVVTTCEYRPEYACYQRAACERQANGECGFTQTPALLSCLARARRGQ